MIKITYTTQNGTFTVVYTGKTVIDALKHFKKTLPGTTATITNILVKQL